MNPSPQTNELQRIQETALAAELAGDQADRDFGREMAFSLLRVLALKSLEQAIDRRGHGGTTSERASEVFHFTLNESADFILTATRAALDFTNDTAAAIHALREPERQRAEEAQARARVAEKTKELEAALSKDMAAAQERISADMVKRTDALVKKDGGH